MDQPIFRPFVEVSLAHDGETTTVLDGLVDTGADAILASDLLAEQLGIDLEDNEGETSHGVGGKYHKAQYKTISLRLHAGDAEVSEYREWEAQVGFLDRFTVTASRFAQAIAVEDRDAFDDRFGVVHAA
jgi:hypothetical protein